MRSHVRACTCLASIAAIIMICAAADAARADWTVSSAASIRHDDNVGNAQGNDDKIADTVAAATLSAFQMIPVGESYSLAAGANLTGVIYDRLTGLRNASVDGALSLKRKWGLGAYAPWARAAVSVGRTNYDDGYRDATIYRASLALGKRVDERWNLWVDYALEHRAASPGQNQDTAVSSDAFSQDGHTWTANVEYSLTERTLLRAAALLRHGDVVSTTAHGGYYLYYSARAIAEDPTFGPDDYAYKITGTTYGVTLSAEYSLTVHTLLGCGFHRLDTHATGCNDYTDSIAEITWNYRF
jgi:hypothetical protein